MSTTYAQRQTTAQKKDANTAASVVDSSSQGESLQRKADMANNATQRAEAPRPNNTGMPDNLKAGIESLSGFSMDDVRVHYNSSKPATVQALAYTQGTDIHVAPGQEKHLPHEAWHVAQQMAGRVSPTTNINGMPVNDNAGLEHEADVMGEKAVQCKDIEDRTSASKNVSMKTRNVQMKMPEMENIPEGFTIHHMVQNKNLLWDKDLLENDSKPIDVSSVKDENKKINALKAISESAKVFGKKTENMDLDESFFVVFNAKYKTAHNHDVTLRTKFEFRRGGITGYAGGAGYVTEVSKTKKDD
ncbi:MAG: DUF4157 domain-containing protein, partial [Fibrobacter sp.]|nr:DUF4157 domain-containing protein [Fibrobacter sp.]